MILVLNCNSCSNHELYSYYKCNTLPILPSGVEWGQPMNNQIDLDYYWIYSSHHTSSISDRDS